MVDYRRNRLPGGTFFFTATLAGRSSQLRVDHIGLLRQGKPFSIDAIVVLPGHLHAIWTLPAGDVDFTGRWRAIRSRFSRLLAGSGAKLRQNAKGGNNLWQRRFWEHTSRDDQDGQRHVDYIHFNPVKHGLALNPADWPFSSIHRYLRTGLIPADWAMDPNTLRNGGFGE